MSLKAAFIFLSPDADSLVHRNVIKTESVELIVIGVANYKEACKVAIELVEQGVAAIELCGGFGNKGVWAVTKAVESKVPIGVVRFDIHPGLANESGDNIF